MATADNCGEIKWSLAFIWNYHEALLTSIVISSDGDDSGKKQTLKTSQGLLRPTKPTKIFGPKINPTAHSTDTAFVAYHNNLVSNNLVELHIHCTQLET